MSDTRPGSGKRPAATAAGKAGKAGKADSKAGGTAGAGAGGRPPGPKAARERAAAERARQAAEARRRERLVRIAAAVAVIVLVVGLGVLYQATRAKVDPNAARPAGIDAVGGGVAIGSAGPVVDVYEDFQCPACGQFERTAGATLTRLAADGKARVVYHPLSFLGEESVRAANAFGCAQDAGKAELFHRTLFADQPAEHSGGYQNAQLIAAGAKAGISGDRFAQCVNGNTYGEWVKQVAREGDDRGVTGTPTIFVGGKELDQDKLTADGITAAVEAAKG